MTNEEKITYLTQAWCEYVGSTHHKDRDMKFYITKEWEYGKPPVYRVEHHGYIGDTIDIETTEKTTVEHLLVTAISKMIDDEIEWMVTDCEPSGDYDEVFCNGIARKNLQAALEKINAS